MDEKLDVLDLKGNPTGKTKFKKDIHNDGDWHKTVHVWIINYKNEILLQKRVGNQKEKDRCDFSAGGHVIANESSLEACIRETKEELGIILNKSELKLLFTTKKKEEKNNTFSDIF